MSTSADLWSDDVWGPDPTPLGEDGWPDVDIPPGGASEHARTLSALYPLSPPAADPEPEPVPAQPFEAVVPAAPAAPAAEPGPDPAAASAAVVGAVAAFVAGAFVPHAGVDSLLRWALVAAVAYLAWLVASRRSPADAAVTVVAAVALLVAGSLSAFIVPVAAAAAAAWWLSRSDA